MSLLGLLVRRADVHARIAPGDAPPREGSASPAGRNGPSVRPDESRRPFSGDDPLRDTEPEPRP